MRLFVANILWSVDDSGLFSLFSDMGFDVSMAKLARDGRVTRLRIRRYRRPGRGDQCDSAVERIQFSRPLDRSGSGEAARARTVTNRENPGVITYRIVSENAAEADSVPNLMTNLTTHKRDEQIRRMVRRFQHLAPNLADRKYTPALRSYCMITLLIERGFSELKSKPLISPETGEIRNSVDVIRRLADTQRVLARELGLTPAAAPLLAKSVTMLDIEALRNEGE